MTVGVNAPKFDVFASSLEWSHNTWTSYSEFAAAAVAEGAGLIGAFYDLDGDGTLECVGLESISTGFFGLALWGDDSSTPEADGLGSGASGVTTTGADATVYLAKTIAVPADTSLVLLDTPIYLMEGDVLKGGASANSDLDLFVSYEVLDDA